MFFNLEITQIEIDEYFDIVFNFDRSMPHFAMQVGIDQSKNDQDKFDLIKKAIDELITSIKTA